MSLLSFLRVLSICVRCHWMLPAWGQRASGTHAIGRVAREGLRSPPGAPGKKSKGSKAEAMQKANQKTQSCYPRARVSHVGRVAREGLRSPPGVPGPIEQQNLGKSVTECI